MLWAGGGRLCSPCFLGLSAMKNLCCLPKPLLALLALVDLVHGAVGLPSSPAPLALAGESGQE
jgi:hypothetical protein